MKIWLWVGGVVGVLLMGALRWLGKQTGMFGLASGMTAVALLLAVLILGYMNRKW